jgi:Tol biopolymer transport system component
MRAMRPSPSRVTVLVMVAAIAMAGSVGCTSAPSRPSSIAPTRSSTPTASAAPTESHRPSPSPIEAPFARGLTGRIAFAIEVGSDIELFTMRADGARRRLVADNLGIDFSPDWSPDGRRLVYRNTPDVTSDASDVHVVNANGTHDVNLTPGRGGRDWSPAWSPDGRTIAFASARSGVLQLYAMAPDGSHLRLVVAGWGEYPQWSPDGTRLVFESRRDGNYEIYRVDADGGGLTRLTDTPQDDKDPSWSPDGSRIVFSSERDSTTTSSSTGLGFDTPSQVYVMNADGTGQTRLTHDAASDTAPSWLPNGLVVFGSDTCFPEPACPGPGTFLIRPDGTGLERVAFPRGQFDWWLP